jgi:hypothetical protein
MKMDKLLKKMDKLLLAQKKINKEFRRLVDQYERCNEKRNTDKKNKEMETGKCGRKKQ